jgi:translation initiation factor 2 beta subunit (eIF-2beta)/eIF-5
MTLLELIAVCWEGDLIDQDIIRGMYSQLYIEFYQKIEQCKNPPKEVEKNGRQMLLACPAAIRLYQQLLSEHANRGKLKPIQ